MRGEGRTKVRGDAQLCVYISEYELSVGGRKGERRKKEGEGQKSKGLHYYAYIAE